MSNQPLVLVVEDDPQMLRYLRTLFGSSDYRFVAESTGNAGLQAAAAHRPDVVLLDLGLPDLSGVEVTRRLREWSAVPIIVISARHMERDKIEALDLGADDYLTKPFSSGELLARVRAALRRAAHGTAEQEPVFECDEIRIDYGARRVTVRGAEVKLTPLEYSLLTILTRNAGKVMTHRQILKDIWGPNSVDQAHYVRIYMGQLRRKLERNPARPEYLLTETGVGYRFRVDS